MIHVKSNVAMHFLDFYSKGGIKANLFYLPDSNGYWLDATLKLEREFTDTLDALQLISFNDYGEGTILEPSVQFGLRDLMKIQRFALGNEDSSVFKLVFRYYKLCSRTKLIKNRARRCSRILNLLLDEDFTRARKKSVKKKNVWGKRIVSRTQITGKKVKQGYGD